jgi:predicted Zn finger-like uncharacterized protein
MLTKILKCPRCSSGFRISSDAIFDGGRQVRCSACKHEWLANPLDLRAEESAPASPTLDEIIASLQPQAEPTPPSSASAMPEEDTEDTVESEDAETFSPSDDFADMMLADFPDIAKESPSLRAASPSRGLKIGLLVGNVAAALVVLLLAGLLFRSSITAILPFTASLYDAVGYGDTQDIQLASLSFSREAKGGVDRYSVKGAIVNHAKREMPTPSIRARLFNKDGEMLKEWLLSRPDTLKPEESRAFNARNLKSGYSSGHMLALEIGSPVELMLRK